MVGTAMVGPSEAKGYAWDDRNFTMIEISPLTVGQMRSMDVGYDYHSLLDRVHYRTVGGAVETFAYARHGGSPLLGLSEGETEGSLLVELAAMRSVRSWSPSHISTSARTSACISTIGLPLTKRHLLRILFLEMVVAT